MIVIDSYEDDRKISNYDEDQTKKALEFRKEKKALTSEYSKLMEVDFHYLPLHLERRLLGSVVAVVTMNRLDTVVLLIAGLIKLLLLYDDRWSVGQGNHDKSLMQIAEDCSVDDSVVDQSLLDS